MSREARSPEELRALAPDLAPLPRRSVDSREALLAAVAAARSDVEAPYVALSDHGSSALFARIERRRIGVRAAYRVVGSFRARIAVVVNDGVVGDDPDWCVEQALALVRGGTVDAVQFQCLRCESPEERALLARTGAMTVQTEDPFVHLEVTVDRPYEALVAGRDSRARESIRRSRRKLDKLGEQRRIERWPADGSDAEVLLASLDAVAARGYQRGMGVGFVRDEIHEGLVRSGLAAGWFRAWVLHIDGAPAAFWTAFAFGDRWTLYETAMDDTHSAAAPGAGLLSYVVEDACADPAVVALGFGLGEARYKRDWADREWMARDVTVFAPRLKWRAVAGLQRAVSWSVTTARRVLGEERVAALKKRLRSRAATSARRGDEPSA